MLIVTWWSLMVLIWSGLLFRNSPAPRFIYTSALHINLISIKITCPMILFINSDYVVGSEKKNFYPNFLLSMVGALPHLGKYMNKFCGNRFHNECAMYTYSLQAIGETTTNQPFWMIQIGSLVIALDHTALLFRWIKKERKTIENQGFFAINFCVLLLYNF